METDQKNNKLIALFLGLSNTCTNLAKQLAGKGFFVHTLTHGDIWKLESDFNVLREHAIALILKAENPILFRQFGPIS